ncbi:MAG TPA: DNA primase [Thermodesulfovibrionales bacterium]|nr:DNA primase [Thermodesulfovibrionales bacterium]
MKFEKLLEEIKTRIDIVDFISEYVQLRKSGQNFKALCPFHSEKTPSFMVNPSKQIFHCFGCGVGGDVVSFLMKLENIPFNEALHNIAKKAGIDLREFKFDKEHTEKRDKILQINREAMNYFIKNLKGSEKAKTYLRKRGIEEDSLKGFSIGYATAERDGLIKHVKKMGYSDSVIKEAGLAVSYEKGSRDIFRERIIFPIFNNQGDTVAFGGRVLDDSLPKYLNSPETGVFKKGETLFGLNLAKEEIRKKGYSLIVEGYLDTIVCHQYGFKNTVAPLGTALTSKQLQRLKPLTGRIVLVFDNDDAGVAASKRSLTILFENNFRAKVLLLPEGEDPDSFLRKEGSQPFKKMLSNAMSVIEFLVVTSKSDKIDTVREALEMISNINDLIIADELLVELSDRTRINETALRGELKKIKKKTRTSISGIVKQDKKIENKEEYLLLSAIISFPEKADYVLSRLDVDDLKVESVRSLFKKIKGLGDKLNTGSILDKADDEEKSMVTELSLKPGFDLEHVDRNIDDCLQNMAQKRFDEKRKQAEESGDITLLNVLLKEKRKLLKGQYERIL